MNEAIANAGTAGLEAVGWATASRWAAEYVGREGLTAPVAEALLKRHAAAFVAEHPDLASGESLAGVLLNNAVWLPHVQAVVPARRLLLLPQCLRDVDACRAERDVAGLLCAQCGRCAIGTLVAEAEALGYVTLVAEGATLVRQLIVGGRVDAVVGVGCMASLEKLFPDMVAFAVPGLAVPLRRAGCIGTEVDAEWVRSVLRLESLGTGLPPRGGLAETVRSWFRRDALVAFLGGEPARDVARLALDVLVQGGKRWRPYLCVAVYDALQPGAVEGEPAARCLALAVECFHKASLVHDDIEDGDAERYGVPTVHATHGVEAAINVGDFLIGEGYRWLAEAMRGIDGERAAEMLMVAAAGHRMLCLGQGDELSRTRMPRALGVEETLAVLTDKTAPAFDVSLRLGALRAGADEPLCAALERFSRAFGTAFQVNDDVVDFESGEDLQAWRPNLVLALLCESDTPAAVRAIGDALGRAKAKLPLDGATLQRAAREAGVMDRAFELRRQFRSQVDTELAGLPNVRVADWLRGIVVQALG